MQKLKHIYMVEGEGAEAGGRGVGAGAGAGGQISWLVQFSKQMNAIFHFGPFSYTVFVKAGINIKSKFSRSKQRRNHTNIYPEFSGS